MPPMGFGGCTVPSHGAALCGDGLKPPSPLRRKLSHPIDTDTLSSLTITPQGISD